MLSDFNFNNVLFDLNFYAVVTWIYMRDRPIHRTITHPMCLKAYDYMLDECRVKIRFMETVELLGGKT